MMINTDKTKKVQYLHIWQSQHINFVDKSFIALNSCKPLQENILICIGNKMINIPFQIDYNSGQKE